jgi:peptide/nickel transport system ATP-binding protein
MSATPVSDDILMSAVDIVKQFPVRSQSVFKRGRDNVHAVDGVTLNVRRGETLGLVGESGCGKSTLGRCLLRLIDPTSGRIIFDGQDITQLSRRQLRPVRAQMQMVFQDPYASLNPRRRVGDILAEPLRVHGSVERARVPSQVGELLETVGLDPAHSNRYPGEFSGGQRQRIGIARALALRPKLIVADEPVSALDVSIQAQVLNLLEDLQEEFGLTYVFVAHDLGVVRHVSDRIGVMYLGEIFEIGPVDAVFERPRHPYTEVLLKAIPQVVSEDNPDPKPQQLRLRGEVPSAIEKPKGCSFHPRCDYATEICRQVTPVLVQLGPQQVACHHPLPLLEGLGSGSGSL